MLKYSLMALSNDCPFEPSKRPRFSSLLLDGQAEPLFFLTTHMYIFYSIQLFMSCFVVSFSTPPSPHHSHWHKVEAVVAVAVGGAAGISNRYEFMASQVMVNCYYHQGLNNAMAASTSLTSSSSFYLNSIAILGNRKIALKRSPGFGRKKYGVVVASSGNLAAPPLWDSWKPDNASSPSLSDILWPSAGAFAAMAILGKMDQILAPKGMSMTIAPLGAVCAVLFATPTSPAARKYNMFMAQIGCAAIGVLAFSIFGPGWLARSAALAASIAFMIYTRSNHPPAASLPILFIDGIKLHHLNFWYALFPGAAGCIILSLLQEVVRYMKENFKF